MSVRFSRNLHKIIGRFWDSASRPHIGDMVMNLFLLWGPPLMTGDGAKMVNFGQKMTKHGRIVNVPKWKSSTKRNRCHNFLNIASKMNQHGLNPLARGSLVAAKKAIKHAKCKMQNAKSVLRVQRWLAPTCPWVTGGRRGLCLASREEAAASPGLQALETHIRESHFVMSVF